MPLHQMGGVALAAAFALALPLAGATPASAHPTTGWSPCGELKDAQAMWDCWAGTNGSHGGTLAASCVPKGNCPPTDQSGHKILNCYYESSWKTAYHCILFCNYGGTFPWGTDGGNNCN